MSEGDVLVEVDGNVALITINRPEQRNAVDAAVATQLGDVMERFEKDPEVGVGILTGAGGRAFSAGADLKAIAAGGGEQLSTLRGGFAGFVRFPRTKPVIAAVNGLALAGGLELVLACDLVVAVEEAEFGLPEVSRGIIAAGGGLFRLPRAIPRFRALELILTAERMGAEEAHRWGMVNHVVASDHLLETARELATRVGANAPLAVRESLGIARLADEIDDEEGWRRSHAAAARIRATADASEGPRAFAEKRAPRWSGL